MANPVIQQNLLVNDPSLVDLINQAKRDININLNCHHIGTIQSFNSAKQTASITINYKRTYFELVAPDIRRPDLKVYSPVSVDYPILLDCPVIVLGGGHGALTFPIKKGDECLVLFNDRNIDNWLQSGQIGPVATARLHSISDGIALVGIRSMANVLTAYDNTRAVLRNGIGGSAYVGVGETLIKIANNTTTLNTLLQDLITEIKAITTSNAVVGSPCTISVASQLALANVATQIAGLLE